MNKEKCGIVRDLMPLVIDDAACEDSKTLVEEHIASCAECRACYAGMAAKLEHLPEPDTAFIRFCRKMEKRMTWKKILKWLAILALAGGIIGFGLRTAYHNIYVNTTEMPTGWVSLSLTQEKGTGVIVETYTMQDGHVYASGAESEFYDHGTLYKAPNKYVWQIGSYKSEMTEFHRVNQLRLIDGKLYSISSYDSDQVYDPGTGEYIETMIPNYEPVTELRLGAPDDYVTVWKEGDEFPSRRTWTS